MPADSKITLVATSSSQDTFAPEIEEYSGHLSSQDTFPPEIEEYSGHLSSQDTFAPEIENTSL